MRICTHFGQDRTGQDMTGQADLQAHFTGIKFQQSSKYEGWNFNSGNYLFTTDTK